MSITSPEDAFAQVAHANGFGGHFDEHLVLEPFDRVFRHHRMRLQSYEAALRRAHDARRQPRAVQIYFAQSPSFNAFAYSGTYRFIGVPYGVVAVVHDIFLRMLASSEVLLTIGQPHSQVNFTKHERLPRNAVDLSASAENPLGLAVVPSDPVRAAAADYLARTALDFLWAHEHQHIEGAHLEWLGGSDGTLCEFGGTLQTLQEALDRQVLELDADSAAVRWTLKMTLDKSNDHWRVPLELREAFEDREDRLVMWMFAVAVLFRVMDECAPSGDYRTRNHPPALMRHYFTLPAMGYILGSMPLRRSKAELIEFIVAEADRGLRSVTTHPPSGAGISDATSREYRSHINLLVDHWRSVRPQLQPLAKSWGGDNAPYEYFEELPDE